MPPNLHRFALVLAFFVCASQARRVQNSLESSDPDSKEYLAELLFALQPSAAGVAAHQRSQPAQMDFYINDVPPAQELAAVGSKFPDFDLDFGFNPIEKINMPERLKGKRVIVLGLPGAFTPTCSSRQIPGYLSKEAELIAKGVAEVIVYCVNDGAVMKAWAADQGVEGSIITFMADTQGELSKALGLRMHHSGPIRKLGWPRCKRHAIYVDDGIIKAIEVAEDPGDPAGDDFPEVTLVENMMTHIPDLSAEEKEAAVAKAAEGEQKSVDEVKGLTAESDLVLFTMPGCPFCEKAKTALEEAGFTPTVITATASQKKGLQKMTGKTSLPSAWVKGEFLGGCDDGVLPAVESGDLKKKLE